MASTGQRGMGSESGRVHADRGELVERIAGVIREDGRVEPRRGLQLARSSSPTDPVHRVYGPAFCVIAQGIKEVHLADGRYRYDPSHYLFTSVELPMVSRVVEASEERPYLGLRLVLDPAVVASAMVEADLPPSRAGAGVKAIDVSPLDASLLDAVVRLVRLLDSPAESRLLAALVIREIVYRLPMGEQGGRLRQIAASGGQAHRIAKAIERLREGLDRPLRIDDLARELGMSASGFHHHFRAITAMSPLRFQKQLRLQEARQLMLGEDLDAASAAFRVGYGDASHFSRDYKRLFGEPPIRDVERLREAARADPDPSPSAPKPRDPSRPS